MDESLETRPLAELRLYVESLKTCQLHTDNNLPKFLIDCVYKEDRPSSTRNLEMLISVGMCAFRNLETISRSICGLQRLRKLQLKGSFVEMIKDLDQLECLEELIFVSADINHLPDSIYRLRNLKSLKLDDIRLLERLPKDLGRLECLEELGLFSEDIKHLPDNIYMFKHLKSLQLRSCSLLEKLPYDLHRLECLENLDLSYTQIKHLPGSICMLKHLKSLNLYDCSLLEKLPEDLGQLEYLEKLDVSLTQIKHLPGSICMLKSLKSLDLNCCSLLEKLPEDLGQLECLEKLSLRRCKSLEDIPNSICQMKSLNYFRLFDCIRVEYLPEELGLLACLEELDIRGTSIRNLPQSISLLKGLRIVGSRGILESCGFTSQIQTNEYNVTFCYVMQTPTAGVSSTLLQV